MKKLRRIKVHAMSLVERKKKKSNNNSWKKKILNRCWMRFPCWCVNNLCGF